MRAALRGALVLGGLIVLAGLLLAGVDALTGERISENRRGERYGVLRELTGMSLAMDTHADVLACERGLFVLAMTERGYGGAMEFAAAFRGGDFVGIRAIRHAETPGFADLLDPLDWIGSLAGRGDYDAVTGATITSSAILRAREAALLRHAAGVPWCPP